jgi:membrane complex biogenesis BtpA family protein
MNTFETVFASAKPIIGFIHLPPLPGFGGHPGLDALVRHALADLDVLMACKIDGVLVENEYDRPHLVSATPAVLAAMKDITSAVVAVGRNIVVGCEILLNDPRASLEVAACSGAQFIRSDYFVDRMSRPGYGEFVIDPEGLVQYRDQHAPGVLILADIQVKYASMIQNRPLVESAELAARAGADAVIVTGDATGDAPRVDHLAEAAKGIAGSGQRIPVLIGSGLNAQNAMPLLQSCDGAIVGTSLMTDSKIDAQKSNALMQVVQRIAAR